MVKLIMKIIIAPDSYKESLSAKEVAGNIERGFREIFPDAEYHQLPMADGGEGTVDAMIAASHGRKISVQVTGPSGQPVTAFYGLSGNGKHAFIEMAAASGLALLAVKQRNPLITTSFGTGELIRHALDRRVSHITVGIGGSATNDGGAGMAQALGVSLCDINQQALPYGGGALINLHHIDISGLDPRIASTRIDVACDVTNPLIGPAGTSVVFGPQKGATLAMVKQLDNALAHYAALLNRDLGCDVSQLTGAGAAGGMGAALHVFCAASLRSGVDIMIELLGLEKLVQDADLVITGEGRLDSQSVRGKVPFGVAKVAKRYHKPVIAIAGCLSDDVQIVCQCGIDVVFSSLHQVGSLDDALQNAAQNIYQTARNVAATLKLASVIDSK